MMGQKTKRMPFAAFLVAAAIGLAGCASGEKQDQQGTPMTEGIPADIPAITLKFDDKGGLPQFIEPKDDDDIALIVTDMGNILLRFCEKGAPKAVENFVTHAKDGYYNNVPFHRIIDGFMIQGGDPLGNGTGGESIWGSPFGVEATVDLFNFTGALSMANAGASDTNGSQFFIVQGNTAKGAEDDLRANGWPEPAVKKYEEVGGYPSLDQKYTVFGQVIGGMDTVEKIVKGEVSDDNGTAVNPVKMNQVLIMKYKEAKAGQRPA